TFYAHLASVNDAIEEGTVITATRPITVGIMGGTGGWRIHLHFGVYYDADDDGEWEEPGEAVDPYGWFGGEADPWPMMPVYLWQHTLWDSSSVGLFDALLTSPSGRGRVNIPADSVAYTVTAELWDSPLPST